MWGVQYNLTINNCCEGNDASANPGHLSQTAEDLRGTAQGLQTIAVVAVLIEKVYLLHRAVAELLQTLQPAVDYCRLL